MSPSDNETANAVVTAEKLPTYLELGWRLDVLCTEKPYRKHRVWYGGWIIRIISPDGAIVKEYNPSEKQLDTTIKTANGLLGHLAAFDPPVSPIPWHVGENSPVDASQMGRRRAPKRKPPA